MGGPLNAVIFSRVRMTVSCLHYLYISLCSCSLFLPWGSLCSIHDSSPFTPSKQSSTAATTYPTRATLHSRLETQVGRELQWLRVLLRACMFVSLSMHTAQICFVRCFCSCGVRSGCHSLSYRSCGLLPYCVCLLHMCYAYMHIRVARHAHCSESCVRCFCSCAVCFACCSRS